MMEDISDPVGDKPEDFTLETVDSRDSQRRNNVGEDADLLQNYWTSPRLVGSVISVILLANSLYIGYAMPVNVLSVINADIGPSPNIYLVTIVYTLLAGVLHLVVARLSDILGRRYFLVGTQLLGVVGSIVCAQASSINMVIGGSVLAGIGGAGGLLYPVLIHELLPNKHRSLGQGAITLTILPTLGFAPAIARTMIAHTTLGWRWCYWFNVIVSGLSVILILACYFPPNFYMINSELTKWQEIKELDYGGLFLYFSGLILVILGFTWAEGIHTWKSAHVITSLVLGVLTLIGFALYETYMPLKQPLLPVKLFKIRNLSACIIIGSTGQMVYLALNVLWPMQINALFTTDNITIGLLSSTTGVALVAGELIFSPLFRVVGYLKWQLVIATAVTAVFGTLMAAVTYDTEHAAIAFTVLAGLAIGWIELVTIVIVGLVAPPNDIGVAQGFFGSTRLVFGTIASKFYLPTSTRSLLICGSQLVSIYVYIPIGWRHSKLKRLFLLLKLLAFLQAAFRRFLSL
jgi:MFS family permease